MWVDIKPQAYAALILWLPVAIVAMASLRPQKGALVAIIGGILLLPELAAFDPPLLPPMDKNAFACIAAYLGILLFAPRELKRAKWLRGPEWWFLLVVVGNIGSAMTNRDPLVVGGGFDYDGITRVPEVVLPALTDYDILSATVRDILELLLPFHLGRALIRTRESAVVLCRVVVGFMALYVPLMLIELRLSPQLHNWVYGYHALQFAHSMRGEGYKPTVFMASGLALAMYVLTAVLCAGILRRLKHTVGGLPNGLLVPAFWGVLAFSRNVGANIYALVAVPLVLAKRGRSAGRLAALLGVLVVAFPLLRAGGYFPTRELVDFAAKYSPARAQSLAFRFENEDILLERADQRIWFGWGGFGRNRVYDERGKDISTTDGEWIIRLGIRGWVGFAGSFGLLVTPIFMLRRRLKRIRAPEDIALVEGFALIVALNAVDLLPNGLFNILPLFWAGCLAGLVEGLPTASSAAESHEASGSGHARSFSAPDHLQGLP